ncbi:putative peroxidase [Medicago truncatula]|uniref:Peroxidase n=1 Tax=Medicago truncatula TaxID=3880 RepID=G7L146_MEDTR|nr:cationic peroxidase 1 [Medicago truncatula]AES78296.1 cationic peroxidase [Medicago truncatula]RHN44897.1 putative peroxidase [Medicago truncatula]
MALSSKLMIKCWLLLNITFLIGISTSVGQLTNEMYYDNTCPNALVAIQQAVQNAVLGEARIGASLLRLHFQDCFVQGCDGSVLLDDTSSFKGEKNSLQNANSLRGFELIDDIKSTLETMCPNVVSCADILTVAARDAVVLLGGQSWNVPLGRRDSTTASLDASNSDIPAPSLNLDGLIATFARKNFTALEMVTLSGAHTIGDARCTSFRGRIYNETNIDPSFAESKRLLCPFNGGDNNISTLSNSSINFDNTYYNDLVSKKGLLHSDQQLLNGLSTSNQVIAYTTDNESFKRDFANVMLKMGMLSPLTGSDGQIRQNCRFINA